MASCMYSIKTRPHPTLVVFRREFLFGLWLLSWHPPTFDAVPSLALGRGAYFAHLPRVMHSAVPVVGLAFGLPSAARGDGRGHVSLSRRVVVAAVSASLGLSPPVSPMAPVADETAGHHHHTSSIGQPDRPVGKGVSTQPSDDATASTQKDDEPEQRSLEPLEQQSAASSRLNAVIEEERSARKRVEAELRVERAARTRLAAELEEQRATSSRLEAEVARLAVQVEELEAGRSAMVHALLAPIERLWLLASFEEQRPAIDNPLLPAVRAAVRNVEVALVAHEFTAIYPTPGEPFDPCSMQLAAKGPVKSDSRIPDVAAVTECLRKGFRNERTQDIVLRATVLIATSGSRKFAETSALQKGEGTSAFQKGTALKHSPSSTDDSFLEERGSVVESRAPLALSTCGTASTAASGPSTYHVRAGDTVSSLALRFGVTPAAIMRTNRLPSAYALLAKPTILIPPPASRSTGVASSDPVVAPSDCAHRCSPQSQHSASVGASWDWARGVARAVLTRYSPGSGVSSSHGLSEAGALLQVHDDD